MNCRKAISINPSYPDAYNNLSLALSELGDHAEAELNCRKAILLRPEFPEALHNLGNMLKFQGKIDEAITAYEHALKINPILLETHRSLADIKKFTIDDHRLIFLTELRKTLTTDSHKAHLYFTLGKAYEDLGNHNEAFKYFLEGNRLRKSLLNYSIEQDRSIFAGVREAFNALPQSSGDVSGLSHVIQIVGMPRSGSTLVEQILASHSQVAGGGELDFLNQLAINGINAKKLLAGSMWRKIALSYSEKLAQHRTSEFWITDKMPLNFRWLGFMLWASPHIKVIHTIRDPMATCWSIFQRYFPANAMGFAYDLEDLGIYYRMYEDLMAFWHEKFPGRIYDLNYERLTENQEEETRNLLEYCGLPWEDRCLEFEKTDRPVRTASAAQVRQKMYKGSSEAWCPYEPHLGPLMKALSGE